MVSVIIITYNRAELIGKSINSVLNQTYTDIELIIIDDGSEDNTAEVVQSFYDNRIKYFRYPHCGYIGILRNAGIKHSSGELVAFNDSDDLWLPSKLERQLQALSLYPEAGFCISDVVVHEHEYIIKTHTYSKQGSTKVENIFAKLRDNTFWVYPSTMILRKSCFVKTGFYTESTRSTDFNFTIRLAHDFAAVVIYEPLVIRTVHANNRSNEYIIQNYFDYIDTFKHLHQRQVIRKRNLRLAKANAYLKLGNIYRSKGELIAARSHYIASLKQKPLQFQGYKQLFQSYIKNT